MVAVLIWIAIKTYKDSVLTFERGLFNSMKRVFKNKIDESDTFII